VSHLSSILIANRGEIACRVIRTATALGYRTVAVYSDADRDAPHVSLADRAVNIGPAPVGQSYLDGAKIIAAAKLAGADAVHPGYGFLSENAGFARACAEAGLTFIGPPIDAIELMGSKRLSKLAMLKAGVPCVPGYEGGDQSEAGLSAAAERIGFPVMLKASMGGGGRGMRLVHDQSQLLDAIRTAKSEAKNAFGSDELIIEKAMVEPRHVEIQVFGDRHGHVIHLGERDCSIQRRHQKVVEESPCPVMTEELRAAMGKAAVEAAKAVNYTGAGTVEFLLDGQKFYFLEMNTRLQVEHPVTEEVTGLDLVAWQLRVAAGEALPLTQDQVQLRGAAIEVRLYAEDPADNFLPQTGHILTWQPARGEGVRIDHGIAQGSVVSPHYDPMLAKIIARGRDREEARRRLIRALADTTLLGVRVNKRFLLSILRHEAFIAGHFSTGFIAQHLQHDPSCKPSHASDTQLALAAALLTAHTGSSQPLRSGLLTARPLTLAEGERKSALTIEELSAERGRTLRVQVLGTLHTAQTNAPDVGANGTAHQMHTVCVLSQHATSWRIEQDGVLRDVTAHVDDQRVLLDTGDGALILDDVTLAPPVSEEGPGSGQLKAPMDGVVVRVDVQAGAKVEKGQVLVLLEAMKIQHQIASDVSGVVQNVSATTGAQVKARQLLVVIQPEAPAENSASA